MPQVIPMENMQGRELVEAGQPCLRKNGCAPAEAPAFATLNCAWHLGTACGWRSKRHVRACSSPLEYALSGLTGQVSSSAAQGRAGQGQRGQMACAVEPSLLGYMTVVKYCTRTLSVSQRLPASGQARGGHQPQLGGALGLQGEGLRPRGGVPWGAPLQVPPLVESFLLVFLKQAGLSVLHAAPVVELWLSIAALVT